MLACLAVLAATTIGALIRYLLGVTGMIGQQDNFLALSEETGDFFLLITKGGLSQCMALLVNALSGVSVFIGAAVFLATKPGYGTQGLLLAFSGGVYVYVAATEAAHTFLHKPLSICMKFGVFICFAIGAVAIGLVLLDHEHCSGNEGGSGDGGAHAGHNH